MANGSTRMALSDIALRNGSGTEELNEEMKNKQSNTISLKASANEHNHSQDSLHNRK